ncbi:MAG: hypothetical protein PHU51_02530 [Candidatus Nanoarchaeia archaeon]|nr:hypothetical protein [Candidatus Nanoarchaeia archaeon]
MINFFKIFSNHKLDGEILEQYQLIYLYVEEIEKDLLLFYKTRWVDYVKKLKENNKELNRDQATLKKIFHFILRLKQEYQNFAPNNKKLHEFRGTQDIADKKELLTNLENIFALLETIQHEVKLSISEEQLKNFSLLHLFKHVNDLIIRDKIYQELIHNDKEKVISLIETIYLDALKKKQEGSLLINGKTKKFTLVYSDSFSSKKLNVLKLIPLLNLKYKENNDELPDLSELEERNNLLFEFHKDATLPVPHYNLLFKGENIHVVPKEESKHLAHLKWGA